MKQDALELVVLRNEFYRQNYRRALMIFLVMVLSNILLVGAVYYLYNDRPEPVYFAVDEYGEITPFYALSDPVLSEIEIKDWSKSAVLQIYSYDFVNWRQQYQKISQLFTPRAGQILKRK